MKVYEGFAPSLFFLHYANRSHHDCAHNSHADYRSSDALKIRQASSEPAYNASAATIWAGCHRRHVSCSAAIRTTYAFDFRQADKALRVSAIIWPFDGDGYSYVFIGWKVGSRRRIRVRFGRRGFHLCNSNSITSYI